MLPNSHTPPRARRSDPETSKEAGRSAPTAKHYEAILEALNEFGPMGCHSIAQVTNLDPSQVFRRMSELQKIGAVCLTGDKVSSPAGRSEREWQAVEVSQ
jgi:predicted ArsR family transcriptional regulator